MSHRSTYPSGVPCWIQTLQPDPTAAAAFYGELLGWQFDAPSPLPAPLTGTAQVARLDGHAVAGLGQAPDGSPSALWATYVRVEDVESALARVTSAGGSVLMGPLGAAPAGRIAVVADPAGVAFGVCEPAANPGAEVVNEPGAWAMSALHTPDPEGAAAFYGRVFGWTLDPVPGTPLALWRLPGHVGGEAGQTLPRDVVAVATPVAPGSGVPPHWAVNLRVADADATAAQATALGGALLMAPADQPGFRSAVIADPQGGVVAISAPQA